MLRRRSPKIGSARPRSAVSQGTARLEPE